MKRNFLFVFLIGSLLLAGFLLNFPQKSFGQEETPTPIEEKPTPTPKPTIQYNLAYPGILPDNPLFKLKVLRDKITAATISDPRKKIEFYLLQTDKGILAAAMLVDKNKIDLAKQTALKAEHNYTLLTHQLYNLPKKPNTKFFKKLKTASLKHQEVLSSFIKRVPKKDQKVFRQVVDFSKRNWESVEKYQKRKLMLK